MMISCLLEPKASLSMMRVSGMVVQWKSVGAVFRLIYRDVLRQIKVKHQNRYLEPINQPPGKPRLCGSLVQIALMSAAWCLASKNTFSLGIFFRHPKVPH